MRGLLVELVTAGPCGGERCPACAPAERVVREVAGRLGLAAPASKPGPGDRAVASYGPGGSIIVRHLACTELPDAGEDEVPFVRLNGHVVLAGPAWGEPELRRAVARFLETAA